jgi:carboxypeptidase Taq
MPRGGSEHRSRQLALLAGLAHEKWTDRRLGDWLSTVEGSRLVSDPEAPEAVNVRELRRCYDRKTKLPRALVEELARETSLAQQVWVEARQRRDFGHFRHALGNIVRLQRSQAECLGYEDSPYDALLEEYEPGTRSRDLVTLFEALRRELVPLVTAILDSPKRPDDSLLDRDYPVDRQRLFGEQIAAVIGFDFERGRLDTAAHPFCTGIGPGDSRITTRYDPRDFTESFTGILHEVGHALYEQGLDPEHYGTPMGEAASLGVHESQSRLWENGVGRSRSFWEFALPLARGLFPGSLGKVDCDGFLFALNAVKPSLIRTQADEVTYNLHIVIRFDLERSLISGDLPVAELPGAWRAAYRRDLGIEPAHDGEGCLQDIHWAAGLFGYFPTYTLGNLYAAQLFDGAERDLGDLSSAFRLGSFRGLLEWLRDRVHRHGQRYRAVDLMTRATGESPTDGPLIASLRKRYGAMYDLEP